MLFYFVLSSICTNFAREKGLPSEGIPLSKQNVYWNT